MRVFCHPWYVDLDQFFYQNSIDTQFVLHMSENNETNKNGYIESLKEQEEDENSGSRSSKHKRTMIEKCLDMSYQDFIKSNITINGWRNLV